MYLRYVDESGDTGIKPNKVIKKHGAKGYFERFESVMCKEASPKAPFGRVWIKK